MERQLNPLFDLRGRVAVVTGATRGIGWATARELANAGAAVVVSSEDAELAKERAETLAADGKPALGVRCDVRNCDELATLVQETLDRFGRLDILVANAGVTLSEGPLAGVTDTDYEAMMEINLHSTLRLANLAAPRIAEVGGGSIVIMSSLSGLRGNRRLGVYSLTKAALAQLARNLAVEWGPANVRANAIAPGVIDTAFAEPLKKKPRRAEAEARANASGTSWRSEGGGGCRRVSRLPRRGVYHRPDTCRRWRNTDRRLECAFSLPALRASSVGRSFALLLRARRTTGSRRWT